VKVFRIGKTVGLPQNGVNARLSEPWHQNAQKWNRFATRSYSRWRSWRKRANLRMVSPLSSHILNRVFVLGLGLNGGGWEGSFCSKGIRSADYLAFYAEHFHTVEVDSTFYGYPESPPAGLPDMPSMKCFAESIESGRMECSHSSREIIGLRSATAAKELLSCISP